ncbi:DUF2975 domain-containing protein [Christiangramia sabulilitoris]|uniref:DUF2975 domain-containing protein n=1 Tax=Christiangramia sabulilitoris TaxID=2583991 RepID=A0A550I0W6_9FLAO|nr:DUF2975 domain-containing protein [Christiangramia sabulilitoris]TRO64458.1 DUF2975 domain-containing protein [Christiangramia sabulilitoris]
MNRNSLLNIANFLCQFFKIIIGVSIIIIAAFFAHFQFERDSYADLKIEEPTNNSIIRFESESIAGKEPLDFQSLRLSDWKTGSLYFTFFKVTMIMTLTYLSLNQFEKVLKSVKDLKTFHQTNVNSLRRIGYYCLLITGLSIFNYWEFGVYAKSSISISLDVLLITLLAFILAEVFKEGNNLLEENQLTI